MFSVSSGVRFQLSQLSQLLTRVKMFRVSVVHVSFATLEFNYVGNISPD